MNGESWRCERNGKNRSTVRVKAVEAMLMWPPFPSTLGQNLATRPVKVCKVTALLKSDWTLERPESGGAVMLDYSNGFYRSPSSLSQCSVPQRRRSSLLGCPTTIATNDCGQRGKADGSASQKGGRGPRRSFHADLRIKVVMVRPCFPP